LADRFRGTPLAVSVRGRRIRGQAFVLLAGVLLLCYASVLVTPYAFLDDYFILAEGIRGEGGTRTQVIASGRPTYAFLLHLAFHAMRDIGDLRYLRLLGVLGIALLAWSFYRTLVFAGWDEYLSLLLSVFVVTMPPFQVYASWATTAFYPFAALAAGGAVHVAERAFSEPRPLLRWGLVGGAVLLMLIALTIHQSAAMFFWVFAAILLFKPDATLPDTVRRLLWYSGIVFAGLILGFGMYKLGTTLYEHALLPTRSHLIQDVWEKALWFFRYPLMNAFNLAKLSPKRWLALVVVFFIIGGLIQYFRGKAGERLWQIGIAAALLPLSYLPNLMIAENWSSYRTQSALTSVVVMYAFLALWGYSRILRRPTATLFLTVMLGFAALGSSLLAAYNVDAYFARPQLLELNFMRGQLTRQDLTQASSIYIIGAKWQDSIAPAVRYDEFGFPSSAASWVPRPAVYLLLRELSPERSSLPLELAPVDGPVSPPPTALIVDMRKLSSLR